MLNYINTDCFINIISFLDPLNLSNLSMLSNNFRNILKDVLRHAPTFKKRIFLFGKSSSFLKIRNNFLFTNKFNCNNIWIFSYNIDSDLSVIAPDKLIINNCFITEQLHIDYKNLTFLSLKDVINVRYLFNNNIMLNKIEHFSLTSVFSYDDYGAIENIIGLLPKSLLSIKLSLDFCSHQVVEKLSYMKDNYFEDCKIIYIF